MIYNKTCHKLGYGLPIGPISQAPILIKLYVCILSGVAGNKSNIIYNFIPFLIRFNLTKNKIIPQQLGRVMGDLYALDFDGVLCDSCGESSLSAVKV